MNTRATQLYFKFPGEITELKVHGKRNRVANKLDQEDRPFHKWYRFVLSFPPHLVRHYISDFKLDSHQTLLDPFCGTGTTIVESKLRGIPAIGIEANRFAHFASTVKTNWNINPDILSQSSRQIANRTLAMLNKQGIDDNTPLNDKIESQTLRTLSAEQMKLLLSDSISAVPLHKTLVLLDCIRQHKDQSCYQHQLLALANALVFTISNLQFGPEVGVGKQKIDTPVVSVWLNELQKMVGDLRGVSNTVWSNSTIHLADARQTHTVLEPNSIDAVITSPPYPNEKDYTRTTRLESVLLGFISNKEELRQLKEGLVRSNTRNVYKGDNDDEWITDHPEIGKIADEIEQRRIMLGKTSGFERLYGKVTKLYFGGMARHLAGLRDVLRPGARLAYVVGDQASYLRVMIRTGELLADIAKVLGYELVRTDLFRTRFATATKQQLREEVVILHWPGK